MSNLGPWVTGCEVLAVAAVILRFLLPDAFVSIHISSRTAVSLLPLRDFLPLVMIVVAGLMAAVVLTRAFIIAGQQ